MKSASVQLAAIIPAYQAAPPLAGVVEATRRHQPVIVVDDGSTDDTRSVAVDSGADVVGLAPNSGKGAALRTGFRRAAERGYEAVVPLDADGQHDPDRIPAFLERREDGGAPLIIGRRDFNVMPLRRRIGNELAARLFSWAVGRPIADNQSGYRLIGPPLLPYLLHIEESGFEFEVEMITTAIRAGLDIDWVSIPTIYDDAGSHIRPVAHVRNFLRVARAARRTVSEPLALGGSV